MTYAFSSSATPDRSDRMLLSYRSHPYCILSDLLFKRFNFARWNHRPGKAKHDTARPINNMTRHSQQSCNRSRATPKKMLAPTSGKRPMLISGMANLVVSVIMIWLECCARPAPPPHDQPVTDHDNWFTKISDSKVG